MKETPIIMSGNHPKLILDGLKTMSRRVIKPQKIYLEDFEDGLQQPCYQIPCGDGSGLIFNKQIRVKCPYGQVGDRLWVRATWSKNHKGQMLFKYQYHALNEMLDLPAIDIKWKSPLHLLKEDAEIWLEITELRAERLRGISPADAIAEGGYTIEEFIRLYLKINRLPEDADPWDWVIGFRRLDV